MENGTSDIFEEIDRIALFKNYPHAVILKESITY
jgi:hypothetical protein